MSERATNAGRSKRLWLLAAVVLTAGAGAWYSAHRRASSPGTGAIAVGKGRPQLFDFGMGVCEQCKRMKPVMERAAREFGAQLDVHVLDIRVEAHEKLAERYQMRAIPFIVFVDGAGKELWRHEGFVGFTELSREVSRRLAPASRTGL